MKMKHMLITVATPRQNESTDESTGQVFDLFPKDEK
jgi:hypothetical protein